MKIHIGFIRLVAILLLAANPQQSHAGSGAPLPSSFTSSTAKIDQIYTLFMNDFNSGKMQNYLTANLKNENVRALYNFQLSTHSLLMMLDQHDIKNVKIQTMILKLAQVYAIAFRAENFYSGKDQNGQIAPVWHCDVGVVPPVFPASTCPNAAKEYDEILLDSGQFSFGAAKVIALLAKLPASARDANADLMLRTNGKLIADMYTRWLNGYSTRKEVLNVSSTEVISNDKESKPIYLDRAPINDKTMQLVAGIIELKRAQSLAPTLVTYANTTVFNTYLKKTLDLMTGPKRLMFFETSGGRYVFDPSRNWRLSKEETWDCPYNATTIALPLTITECKDATLYNHTYDISHYQRVVYLFDTLKRYPATNLPTTVLIPVTQIKTYIQGMSRHFRVRVSNWNPESTVITPPNPIQFKNYFGNFNGLSLNGWYRLSVESNTSNLVESSSTRSAYELSGSGPVYFAWGQEDAPMLKLAQAYFNQKPVLDRSGDFYTNYTFDQAARIPVIVLP